MAEPLETPCAIAIYRGQSGFLDPSTPFKPLSEERGKKRPPLDFPRGREALERLRVNPEHALYARPSLQCRRVDKNCY